MVCLYMYIKYTAKNITVNQTKKKVFFSKIQKITFISYLLQTIDVFCRFIAECPSKYFYSLFHCFCTVNVYVRCWIIQYSTDIQCFISLTSGHYILYEWMLHQDLEGQRFHIVTAQLLIHT